MIYSAVTPGYDKEAFVRALDPPEAMVECELRQHAFESQRDAVLWNREQKIMRPPTTGLWSVYIDGSLKPRVPLRGVVEEWLASADMALFKHPHRTCAYDEIDACVKRGKISVEVAEKARAHLLLAGFPRHFGLWACGMVARRTHANSLQIFLAPLWWEMTREVPRDQIWLPYLLWKLRHSVKRVHTIDADIFDNQFFSFRRHGT